MATQLKLSEGIRLGAMLRPQYFGMLFGFLSIDQLGSCAFGAALEAAGLVRAELLDSVPREKVPNEWLRMIGRYACPECGNLMHDGLCLVVHLNDLHRWSREVIADLVESTIESSQFDWGAVPLVAETAPAECASPVPVG